MKKILIIEDEMAIAKVLSAYLKQAGFQVKIVSDGSNAMDCFIEYKPSLVLLDVMLPYRSGWDILQQIRQMSSCPVIMLTALGQMKEKLQGFSEGADDYITKPFDPDEVVARVHAVMRRSVHVADKATGIVYGNLKIDIKGRNVYVAGVSVEVLPRDLAVLLFLAEHPNQTFTREQLLDCIWGMDYEGSDRAVDLSIKRLRKALKGWDTMSGEIKTLRGLGYQFCVYE
ncbi:response regulator transcription factor [Bacillus sp. 165]|uniref:response regulator transcription factor n=1 Tax=Bacillus sp. 165 TaxID=1529117 RepID=UPI001ADAB4AF|nr:response regulator transcription factor [Bacillus sp. 165]MBO9129024.1 response regulator transcription factor [Bacillus sp. 165]